MVGAQVCTEGLLPFEMLCVQYNIHVYVEGDMIDCSYTCSVWHHRLTVEDSTQSFTPYGQMGEWLAVIG